MLGRLLRSYTVVGVNELTAIVIDNYYQHESSLNVLEVSVHTFAAVVVLVMFLTYL